MDKEEILKLVKERLDLYEADEKDVRVDEIRDTITNELKSNFNAYEVDFIIETLTTFGQAPNVMYDDNGLFAVSGDGYQPLVYGDKKIEGMISVYVTEKHWFKTIREALWFYMNYEY